MRYSMTVAMIMPGVVLMAGLAGCEKGAGVGQAASTQPALSEYEPDPCMALADSMDFTDCMITKPKCTFANAVRAVSAFMHGGDVAEGFAGQYRWLAERDVVRSEWRLSGDAWVDRGTLAYMLYRAMELRGGVNMAVFGAWGLGDRRYAYRELRYRRVMDAGVSYQVVSGPEIITIIGKADEYMRDTGRYGAEETLELSDFPQEAME